MKRATCQIAGAFLVIALSFTFVYAQKLSAGEQTIID